MDSGEGETVSEASTGEGVRPQCRTRVKFCGITRPADARSAARLGVDAIGLVFYPPSPRAVQIEQARAIVAALPPFVSVVGLFVNAEPRAIREVLAAVPLHLLQFHGEETCSDCERYGVPYIKAVRMREGVDLQACAARYAGAAGLLVDAWRPDRWGGSGQTFEWSLIPSGIAKPLILAGGLTPANVADALRVVAPYGVDVSGGIESSGGVKDPVKMAAFVHEVNSVAEFEAQA